MLYAIPCSGFGSYINPKNEFQRYKTLWDWMQLLVVPALLAGFAAWFTLQRERLARDIEESRTREERLQTYFDRMTELMLDKALSSSVPGAKVRDIARARTLTVLRSLDGERKGDLPRFLREADLITATNSIIMLDGADLVRADLSGADLSEANLSEANLVEADLSGADLNGANLSEAKLIHANLSQADLIGADLSEADLSGADLSRAALAEADLSEANLSGANLSGASLVKADLSEAKLIHANLSGANLSRADLTAALKGANLIRAKLPGHRPRRSPRINSRAS